jgi:polyisoprenoid-binding protein YceI
MKEHRTISFLLTISLLSMFCSVESASAQQFSSGEGHVEFRSHVPLHSFTGRSDELIGAVNLETGIVDFYVDLETLKTGNGKRDKDMRKALGTKEYPFAEFFGTLSSTFDPEKEGPQEAAVSGTFTVHGVPQPLELIGTMEMKDGDLLVVAAWSVFLKDHKIKPPRLLIIKVDDEQQISINIRLGPDH